MEIQYKRLRLLYINLDFIIYYIVYIEIIFLYLEKSI